jgi:hypothetical protein
VPIDAAASFQFLGAAIAGLPIGEPLPWLAEVIPEERLPALSAGTARPNRHM